MSKDLTFNIGLRFDHDSPLYERYNRAIASFNPTLTTPLSSAAEAAYAKNPIAQIPVGQFQVPGGVVYASNARSQLFSTDSYTFSPRLGFAWTQPNSGGKTTVTGGFSLFVFPVQNLATIDSTGFSQTTAYVATNENYVTAAASVANPFPNGLLQPAGPHTCLRPRIGFDEWPLQRSLHCAGGNQKILITGLRSTCYTQAAG